MVHRRNHGDRGGPVAAHFGMHASTGAPPMIGQPIPDVTLLRLEGDGEFRLRHVAVEMLVVNDWASWVCVLPR